MQKLLLSLFLLIVSSSVFAQHRSEQEAMQIAQEFFGKNGLSTQLSVVSNQKVRTQIQRRVPGAKRAQAKNASFYVVNDEANNRFVIVSADERMYQILGYSDNGTFDEDDVPDGLLFLMESYNNQYSLVEESQLVHRAKRDGKKTPIAPLIQSLWGQDNPYNLDCPIVKDDEGKSLLSVSGCVATAMAQAMNYYKYPQNGSGDNAFYWLKSTKSFHSFNFSDLTLNWENITNIYDENSTDAQRTEVAKLMHACGASVLMQYNTSSSANPGDIPYAMIHNFGYNPNMQYVVKDYYSSEEWNTLIENELKAGRPILYGGSGSTIFLGQNIGEGGHRFILDGMDEYGLYHFNFGWEGNCDGYFSVDAINPSQLGGLLTYDFNSTQGMVIGVTPEQIGEPKDIFYTITLQLDTIVTVNSKTEIVFQPYCCSNLSNEQHNFSGELGIGAFDKDWNLVKTIAQLNGSGLSAGYWNSTTKTTSFRYDSSTFSEGSQYYVALYAKHDNSQKPTLVRTKYGEKDWYRAIVKDNKVYLNRKAIVDDGSDVIHTDPVYPSIREGLYNVTALNQNGESAKWKITITRDMADTTLYYFSNIDSALSNRNIAIKDVSGTIDTDGKLKLANRQIVGDNYELNNFSSADSIEIITYPSQNLMEIIGYWGVVETVTGNVVSKYHETKFTEPKEDDIVIPNPAINVSEQHILTINCADKDASIYYTYSANGVEPSVSSLKYTEPVSLTRNGIAKAIAIKDGLQSDIVSYEVNTFVVDKPSIVPVAEGSKTINPNRSLD
ncbi:MAG: C10 family peptidase [Prevotella sp.]|nr:C10 family peptidase [Prevotella sp.]